MSKKIQLCEKDACGKKPLAEVAEKLLMALDSIVSNGKRYVFLGDYKELPDYFTGNDIDILVTDINIALQAFSKCGFVIRRHGRFEFRAFSFSQSQRNWIAIDIETVDNYTSGRDHKILEYCIENSKKKGLYQLNFAPKEALLAYKTAKYLINGFVHSEYQLLNLKEAWQESPDDVCKMARHLLCVEALKEPTKIWVNEFSTCRSVPTSELLIKQELKEYIINRRKVRHADRVVFQGNIKKKGFFRSTRMVFSFFWALLRGKGANPWPAIAIVGNDGSGKSEICQRLKDRLYKIDPLHIVMRGNASWLPGWNFIRTPYIAIIQTLRGHRIFSPAAWLGAWIGEFVEFIDKFLRYRVGMAWAKAGFGFVIFERYSTDRLRGEYPGPGWSLFPLEQFFPFPDAIILLDVTEEDSLKRKPGDGHSYEEMNEKRQNYLRLINEIEPHFIVPAGLGLDEVELRISEIIWTLVVEMQSSGQSQRNNRAVWSPKKRDYNASIKKRRQKHGFF